MYKKQCPRCNENYLIYKTKQGLSNSIKNKVFCLDCKKKIRNKKKFAIYIRLCPSCNDDIKYKSNGARTTGKRKKTNCSKCYVNSMYGKHHSIETREKISKKIINLYQGDKGEKRKETVRKLYLNKTYEEIHGKEKAKEIKKKIGNSVKGEKNGFYGKKHTKETRRKMSESKKGTQAGEKNPMYGKPSPVGSGNGWSGWYKEWFFRSLRELSYMINVIERFNFNWISGENNKHIIPYIDYDGRKRNYFVDFIINNKYMVEIKPKKLHLSKSVLLKKYAAINWCSSRGLIYKIMDSKILPSSKIKKLHDKKEIIFTKRYEKKFKEKYNE